MSATVETVEVPPGEDDRAEEVWELKERIRESEGVLRQRKGFFRRAYRQSAAHLLVVDDEVVGFAVVRGDGYLLFLGVAPEHRGEGLGRRLVERVAEDYSTITCHARTTNREALAFYKSLGFGVTRRIDGYYEDGGDALYLELDEGQSLGEWISRLFGR